MGDEEKTMNTLPSSTEAIKTPWPVYGPEDVINYIGRVRERWEGEYEGYSDIVHKHYSAGYCYHFAKNLQMIFGRGHVCYVFPISHVVWEDVDGNCYDIDGLVSPDMGLYYVPVEYLGTKGLESFLHVGDYDSGDDLSYKGRYFALRGLFAWAHDYHIEVELDYKVDDKVRAMFGEHHMYELNILNKSGESEGPATDAKPMTPEEGKSIIERSLAKIREYRQKLL